MTPLLSRAQPVAYVAAGSLTPSASLALERNVAIWELASRKLRTRHAYLRMSPVTQLGICVIRLLPATDRKAVRLDMPPLASDAIGVTGADDIDDAAEASAASWI